MTLLSRIILITILSHEQVVAIPTRNTAGNSIGVNAEIHIANSFTNVPTAMAEATVYTTVSRKTGKKGKMVEANEPVGSEKIKKNLTETQLAINFNCNG